MPCNNNLKYKKKLILLQLGMLLLLRYSVARLSMLFLWVTLLEGILLFFLLRREKVGLYSLIKGSKMRL